MNNAVNEFDMNYTNEQLGYRNFEALHAITKTLDISGNEEVPFYTVVQMYPNYYDMKHGLTEKELEYRMRKLIDVGAVSLRMGSFGTEMISVPNRNVPLLDL
ncbi:hypothetical protein TCA2_4499 [Paenibacillus sp. TCA20]|uniref:hypothetical protein n=1 Tax=Paenibacillus sp. TCA20 TaxID=1499968 RepID=UPI0004DA9C51|nr:hypothetical protein [Paenibacillus sp. TCA20]GAK42007.1 hypothetical protein TCA2_4499 [Paenibacillus sp. TCA20]